MKVDKSEKDFLIMTSSLMNIKNGDPVETDAVESAKTVEASRSIVKSSVTGEIVRPDYNF